MTGNTRAKIELRPRQREMVEKAFKRLTKEGKDNTLCIAPTGAGKTIVLSAIVGRFLQQGKEKANESPRDSA